jgi:hypothetical protein
MLKSFTLFKCRKRASRLIAGNFATVKRKRKLLFTVQLFCSTPDAVRIPVPAQPLEARYEENHKYCSAPEGEQRNRDPCPDAVCEHHARLRGSDPHVTHNGFYWLF